MPLHLHRSARVTVDGQLYVLKQISLRNLSIKEQTACVTEVRLLAAVDSEYIVRYYDSFISHSNTNADGDATRSNGDANGVLNLVQEYCEDGDLQQYLKRHQQQHPDGTLLPESTIWSFFIQILLALAALHSRSILHRDVKPANFFLAKGGRLKMGDLGVAKLLSTESAYGVTMCGTPYFLSPELCEGKNYNEKSDIWSVGVCLFQLLTLRQPFEAGNQGALILKILRGRYPALPGIYTGTKFPRILDALLRKDTNLRPTAVQVLASAAVYAKARELGWTLPEEVERMVDRRKKGQMPPAVKKQDVVERASAQRQNAPLLPKSRTQALPSATSSNDPSSSPTSSPAAAADASFHRTTVLLPTKKNHRTGGGRGRMGKSSVLSNAPIISGVAPARPTPGLVQPILRPPKQSTGLRKPKRSPPAEAASVANLPDHVPGAPMSRPIGSFVPSPDADAPESTAQLFQAKVTAALAGKPSVRAFQQALSNPVVAPPKLLSTAHFAQSPVAAMDASMVNQPSSNEQSMHTSRSQEEQVNESDSEHASSADNSSADFFDDEDSIDADLVDTTGEEQHDPLSGSADEVQWRILEEEMDANARREAGEVDLYDEDNEAVEEAVSEHNTTLLPSSSIPPLAHHVPTPQLLHAVQARIEHLQTHQSYLQREIEVVIGEEGFQELFDYFSQEAAAVSSPSSSDELSDASSSPLLPSVISDLLESSRERRPDFDALTRVYQMIYLDEEIQRCRDVLRLAGVAPTADGSPAEPRNHTPQLPEATTALDTTSNLTFKREAVLHRNLGANPPSAAIGFSSASQPVSNRVAVTGRRA